jgi:hypothetical protein
MNQHQKKNQEEDIYSSDDSGLIEGEKRYLI